MSRTPKEIQERRKTRKPHSEGSSWDWKYWVGFGVTIAGLILGALGLRSKPTVSLDPPLDAANPLTAQVVLSNDGMLPLEDVSVASFIGQANYEQGSTANGNLGTGFTPNNQTLDIGDRETVPLGSFFHAYTNRMTYADVALIVSFKPKFMPFWSRTKPFRFKTVKQADGTLRFQQQPPGDILDQYEQVRNRQLPRQ